MAKASSNLRVIHPGKEETFLFVWEINDQQRLQRPSSSSYVDAKHLVSNQARLQEIAEMTESRQIDKAARQEARFQIGRVAVWDYGCVMDMDVFQTKVNCLMNFEMSECQCSLCAQQKVNTVWTIL